jgi:hypothetical protein
MIAYTVAGRTRRRRLMRPGLDGRGGSAASKSDPDAGMLIDRIIGKKIARNMKAVTHSFVCSQKGCRAFKEKKRSVRVAVFRVTY